MCYATAINCFCVNEFVVFDQCEKIPIYLNLFCIECVFHCSVLSLLVSIWTSEIIHAIARVCVIVVGEGRASTTFFIQFEISIVSLLFLNSFVHDVFYGCYRLNISSFKIIRFAYYFFFFKQRLNIQFRVWSSIDADIVVVCMRHEREKK